MVFENASTLMPVSYTHLDVYKRQDQSRREDNYPIERNHRIAEPNTEDLSLIHI